MALTFWWQQYWWIAHISQVRFFYLYRVFCPPVQMNDCICTGCSQQPLQMSSHRGWSASDPTQPVRINASHLYRLVAPTGTNVRPSHLNRAKTRAGTNVQRLQFLLLPPARAPSSLFFFLSPTRAPPPQWRPRELLPDLRRFLHDFTHWSGVQVN
jgi:hypothetical protein